MDAFPAAIPPERLLLGPGPSPVHPRVLEAAGRGIIGHLDPFTFEMADQIVAMLRHVFRTSNDRTFVVSGTGSAGLETAVVNLIEPGDTVIVGVNGVFGGRLADMARRAGAEVVALEERWGRPIPGERVESALKAHPGAKAVALVHAETSTGAQQPLEEIGAMLRDTDTLFMVDAVTSLGGVPLEVDAWGIDAAYGCTQKCLSVPPGLAPITFSPKAEQVIDQRQTTVRSWYLDMKGVYNWWGPNHSYHHTMPVTALMGLHEGLRMVLEEGVEARWARHEEVGRLFQDHVQDRDAVLLAEEGHRLPHLVPLAWPDHVDEGDLRRRLLETYNIEVAGGLGEYAGKAWRVGLMGEGARHEHMDRLLDAVDELLET